MYTIFNMVHVMSCMNNAYQFQDIWRIFTRVKACTDRQTEKGIKITISEERNNGCFQFIFQDLIFVKQVLDIARNIWLLFIHKNVIFSFQTNNVLTGQNKWKRKKNEMWCDICIRFIFKSLF